MKKTVKQWQIDNPGYELFKPGYVLRFDDGELRIKQRWVRGDTGDLTLDAVIPDEKYGEYGLFRVDSPTQITGYQALRAGRTYNLVDGVWK